MRFRGELYSVVFGAIWRLAISRLTKSLMRQGCSKTTATNTGVIHLGMRLANGVCDLIIERYNIEPLVIHFYSIS